MHCAIVKVLPDPVTPSSTCAWSPRLRPSTSSSIARRLVAAQLEIGDQLEAVVLGGHTVAVQWRLAKRTRNAHRTTSLGARDRGTEPESGGTASRAD